LQWQGDGYSRYSVFQQQLVIFRPGFDFHLEKIKFPIACVSIHTSFLGFLDVLELALAYRFSDWQRYRVFFRVSS